MIGMRSNPVDCPLVIAAASVVVSARCLESLSLTIITVNVSINSTCVAKRFEFFSQVNQPLVCVSGLFHIGEGEVACVFLKCQTIVVLS